MEFKIQKKFPTNEEFNELFDSVGWGNRDDEKINKHREMSAFAVSVFAENKIVGMARVVGDGAYFTVYDVVTRKEFQCKGIGSLMMNEIVKWYELVKDDDTYLYLGASAGRENFYKKFGFKARPYTGIGAGMKYDVD
ncbi:MAG: GNAT family N-acetyltransferase [Clostridia bacterium]|nr:GNAT family N-acetyltransferase [Clostridia bacterium]